MRLNIIPSLFLTLVTTLSVETAHANNILKHFELSGAGGVNWGNSDNTHLDVSTTETDKLKISSKSTDGAWKVGLGYEVFDDQVHQRDFYNSLLLELNVYQVSTTIDGDVWQYELPQFNNYTFTAPITSTRLMLDVKPTLTTWNQFSPYLIVGIGSAWNTVSYDETAMPGVDPSSALSLSSHTRVQVALDLGLGLNVTATEHVSLMAEYIYAYLGKATPEKTATNGFVLVEAPNFSYKTQTLLLGVSVKY
jgi:opacity protein-like surface antigen